MDELLNILDVNNNNPTNEEIFFCVKYVHNILEKYKIKHWLMYGTLLGAIREKDIIPHDYDFDFGLLIEDVDKILNIQQEDKNIKFEKLYNSCYKKSSQFKEMDRLWKVSIGVSYKDKIIGDLYVYYNCKDGYTRRYDPVNKLLFWPNSTFPSIFINTLDFGYIRGIKMPIPNHPILLLEYFYGPMWVTPIKSLSQEGGTGHEDYDYYGGYKYSKLENLKNRVIEEYEKEGQNIEIGNPCLKEEDVEYMFPKGQLKWIKENENLIFNFKQKKK